MTVGKAIYNLLLSNAALRAIVDTRIFPEVAQQDAELPYVVYNISSNEPSDTKREPSKMDTAQVEVNLYSTSYTECIDMATHVRAALDRVTGTYSGVNVQSIQYLGEVIDFDEAQRAYNITSDYDVRVSRSNFEIAQGSPITGVTLGELSDVDTTGVTDGQVIAYDAAAQEWQPADDAGGVTQLGQLDDVTLNNTAQGELLKYDGNDWVNDTIDKSDVSLGNVDNTSDADKPISTATQTALDDKADSSDVPTELDDLSDVKIIGAPSAGQSLVYNSGFFQLGQAGATTLGALDDVNTVGAAFGSLLAYNGSTGWDISAAALPTDDIYFHQRYVTESEALRSGATATVELYFACTAQGNGLAEDAESDTPTAGKIINRKIYYSESAFADPDTGTWVEFTTLADDITFANAKAALLEYLKARTGGTVPISLKQTWEEVTAAPAFTGLLNETYGSGAEAAYSTRRLNGNVTDCMVIRRASDSTTTTIGFDGSGNISEADIESFCTGTTCTVYQWADQSGNGNTATAASGQEPTIYTGGALVKIDGKVAMTLDGSNDAFTTSSNIVGAYSIFTLGNPAAGGYYADSTSGDRQYIIRNSAVAGSFSEYQNGTATNNIYDFRKELVAYISNSATTRVINTLLSRYNKISSYNGDFSEYIIYTSDKSANRTDIEENIGDYFTQNTPLLDTYTGAAAAYSLRKLSSSYSGSAVEVYNGSSYADIGFNVFGELDTVALAAHCGSNDGFVSKWYDQSSNSVTVSQTNTGSMPKIYDGTTGVVTAGSAGNEKPAVEFDGVNDVVYQNSNLYIAGSQRNSFAVAKLNSTASDWGIFNTDWSPRVAQNMRSSTGTDFSSIIFSPNTTPITTLTGSTTLSTNQYLFESEYVNTDFSVYLNGSEDGTTTHASAKTGACDLSIGASFRNSNARFNGKIQELICYEESKSDQRSDIASNINTFYNIYS